MPLGRSSLVPRAILALSPVLLVLALGATSRGGAPPDRAPATPTYYQNVKPILEGRCTGCHYRGGIAPFALTTYGAARAHRAEMASAVRRRLMPPWRADSRYRRYLYDPSLTRAQIATIVRWAATGARKGDPARGAPPVPSVAPHLSRVDARLSMPSAYTPRRRAGGDDYRCFVLPWTAGRERFVTGFNVKPRQRREVHHMILFMAAPAEASTVDAWEAADARPGYSCYGGPSLTGGQEIVAQFVAGWVPGSFGTDFPSGTGIRIPPGSRLILQVHYNLESTRPRPDRSVVELKLDDAVAKRAIYMPLVNFAWVISPSTFQIPAGRRNIVHTFSADPRQVVPFFDRELDVSRGLVVHSALLHMHRLGRSGQIAIQRAGSSEILLAIARWEFDWQREYYFAEPEVLAPGERLSIRCVHDNSRRGQPLVNGKRRRPRRVTWGENSSDEMCIGFLYVSEP